MQIAELIDQRKSLLGKDSYLFYDEPLHIVRGEGVWLYEADGRQYLDVYNNVPHVGHCHPHVVDAITKQINTLNVHTRYLHEYILDYAARLTATFDESLDVVTFTCTGSESNELALRIARKHTGKIGIICTNCAYHGNTAAVWELASVIQDEVKNTPNVRAVPFPDSYRSVFEKKGEALGEAYAVEVKKAIELFNADGIGLAGIIVCPIFSGEGLPDVPQGYMEKAVSHVHDAGGLFISDEVQAGFGRTGKNMWGHQLYDVTPDIITLGKPMGNGHPIAGVITRADLLNEFTQGLFYFNTFGGNPVSCAAGMAVLDVIENENLLENAVCVGDYVRTGCIKLQAKHELIGDVRGHGLFFGVELVSDKEQKIPAIAETKQLVNEMRRRGVLISSIGPYGNVLKMRPPMIFSEENADQLLSTLDDVLYTL